MNPGLATAPPLEDTPTDEPYFNPDEVDVVKVTVDRREKNIQDYGGSATVLTEQDMTRIGISSVRNMSSATPYVEIGNQEGNTEIYIRGVGSDNNTELGDPASATHIDGVYIPRPRGVGSMFFDLERVEINRGPQGTIRGRNATAGSMNIVTAKPKLGEFGAEGSVQLGNYSQRLTRGMINIPIGERLALRMATFSEVHDPFYENAGPIHTLRAAESADVLAYRAALKWVPVDAVTVNLQHDYTQEGGTGYSGTNFAGPLNAGILPEEIDDPRRVIYRGPQASQDMVHWGLMGNITVDLGPALIEYVGSYRNLDYKQVTGGNAGIPYPGRGPLAQDDLDNWSTSYWHTESESVVQELRLYAPDTARFRWTLGGFFYNEEQTAFLGSTQDQSNAYAGNEFNMPDANAQSWAGYADGTLDILQNLRGIAGVRVTHESKERDGIGYVYGFNNVPENFRFGTEGFKFRGRDRTDYTLDPNRDPMSGNILAPFDDFRNGIARFGVRDTLQDVLEDPNVSMWSALNEQHGSYSDTFVDFRVGAEFDLRPENLLYATFSTAHKSGGFNDTFTVEGVTIAPTYDPESLYALEIGSKNELADRKLILNVSAFWYEYKDMQFVSIQQLVETDDPDQAPSSSVRFNAAASRVLGLEADVNWRLPGGFVAGVAAMLLDARFTEGVVADTRRGFDAQSQGEFDLEGNYLTRAPVLSLNYSLGQNIESPIGYFDWIASAQTKTKHYMTVFNGEGREQDGTVNPLLSDVVPTYTRLDLGAGWTRSEGDLRLEGFISNVLDTTYVTSIINTPGLNLRFFNPPRQYGVKLSVYL